MLTIATALQWAVKELSAENPVANLEAEVLLAHSLQVPRSYFYAWPERSLSELEQRQFAQLIQRKQQGEPVAYLTGKKNSGR